LSPSPAKSSAQPEPWFRSAFDDFYMSLYAHRNDEDARRAMDFLLRESIVRTGERGLDLCCGPGRHLIELLKAGLSVAGLDLSLPLLQRAGRRLREANLAPELVRASMERLPFCPAQFHLVVNLFTSFGYFDRDEDNARVFEEVARTLQPGGRFLIDFLNAPHVRATLVAESDEVRADGTRIATRRSIDGERPRVIKRVQVARGDHHRDIVESVRLFERAELEQMLSAAGLVVQHVWGDFNSSHWSEAAPRCIILSQKI